MCIAQTGRVIGRLDIPASSSPSGWSSPDLSVPTDYFSVMIDDELPVPTLKLDGRKAGADVNIILL